MTISGDNSPVDYIFGELDQPQNAARWMKLRLSGVHHYARKFPDSPKPDEPVIIKVTTDVGQVYEDIFIWFTTDDWQTTRKMPLEKHRLVWNSVAWCYIQEWQVTLPPQSEGVMLRYKIGAAISGSEAFIFTDNQSNSYDEATHYSIWYGNDNNPAWAKRAIVYQIFVDRFNPGKEKHWKQTSELRKPFGGTLAGIIEKLPYIKALGFNSIWLTPIFDSPTHHGYDICDYFQINPRFGTLAEFKQLIVKAHRLEIKVILDFVANHCSSRHPFFQDAHKNKNSDYHDWFVWKKWPDYESFFNVGNMPKMNLAYGSPAREHLLEAAQYWLEIGVDGYRLDYASGPEHDFWVDFRHVCASVNQDIWTFGELVLPADIQTTYSDGLGGTLDFLLCQAMRATFGSQVWKLSKFAGFINSHYRYYPEDYSLPSFIDNHDMDRFYTIAGDDLQCLKLALLVLYVLPEPPIIYYGTELPLSQNKLIHAGGGLGFDEARLEMDWQNQTASDIPAYLCKLAEIRSNFSAKPNLLRHIVLINETKQILGIATKEEKEILIINRSNCQQEVTIPLKSKNGEYCDLLTDVTYQYFNNNLDISLPASSGIYLSTIK